MNLTTPEIRDYDPAMPGENWFFYWKTASSFWRSKIKEQNSYKTLFVPINWGLHLDRPNEFDFGQYRPETNLVKLLQIAQEENHELIFVLGLSPSPFLANGGIPSFLARSPSMNHNGINICNIDSDGRLNKIYSYFDPKLFQHFRKYVVALKNYFKSSGVRPKIYLADYGYMEKDSFHSYFDDYSKVFYEGLARYTDHLKSTDVNFNQKNINPKILERKYNNEIKSLYQNTAKEVLSDLIEGEVAFSFLGGAALDIFDRTADLLDVNSVYFKQLYNIVTHDHYPVTTLLKGDQKSGAFNKGLKDLFTESFIQSGLGHSAYEDSDLNFNPLVFCELLILDQEEKNEKDAYFDMGLISFLNINYKSSYRYRHHLNISLETDENNSILYAIGKYLKNSDFNQIVKYLLNGGKIVIDQSELSKEFLSKIELFLTENKIQTEKLFFNTKVTRASLGDGQIILFEGDTLVKTTVAQRQIFWEKLFSFFQLNHVKVQTDEEVNYFWKKRASSTYELDYQEIRKVSIYNSSSYKKKAHLIAARNFAYLKAIDPINVTVKTSPLGVDVELNPGASVSLDFGYFELS